MARRQREVQASSLWQSESFFFSSTIFDPNISTPSEASIPLDGVRYGKPQKIDPSYSSSSTLCNQGFVQSMQEPAIRFQPDRSLHAFTRPSRLSLMPSPHVRSKQLFLTREFLMT